MRKKLSLHPCGNPLLIPWLSLSARGPVQTWWEWRTGQQDCSCQLTKPGSDGDDTYPARALGHQLPRGHDPRNPPLELLLHEAD